MNKKEADKEIINKDLAYVLFKIKNIPKKYPIIEPKESDISTHNEKSAN